MLCDMEVTDLKFKKLQTLFQTLNLANTCMCLTCFPKLPSNVAEHMGVSPLFVQSQTETVW